MRENEWRTRMARLAATEFGADWIIATDADEFWMPRGGTLEDVLAAIPDRYGVASALTRHFVPRPDDGIFFAERMTARVSPAAAINDPTSPFRPHSKIAHRADPDVIVNMGAHSIRSSRLAPLRDWYPAAVHHFPFRSLEQYERKNVQGARSYTKPLAQYAKGVQARAEGRIAAVYRSLVVDDATVERGVVAGSIVVDTRLRDALRALRVDGAEVGSLHSAAGHFSLPSPSSSRSSSRVLPEVARDLYAIDAAALDEANLVRLVRRLDVLRPRLDAVEDRTWARGARARHGGAFGA
jgi:hypothetical protein